MSGSRGVGASEAVIRSLMQGPMSRDELVAELAPRSSGEVDVTLWLLVATGRIMPQHLLTEPPRTVYRLVSGPPRTVKPT